MRDSAGRWNACCTGAGSDVLLIAVVGKPNSGKSSFFKAATMIDVKISPVPFTTIRPNLGVASVRVKCPDADFGVKCSPRYGYCSNGVRWLPIQLMDVAGLVPGAHQGRGIGNQFLDDLRKANCLIHVVDASGTSDFEGNPAQGHDPCEDIRFLENEIDMWFKSILEKNWAAIERRTSTSEKMEDVLADVLSGLSMSRGQIEFAVSKIGVVGSNNLLEFASLLRKVSKPIIIAANKMDMSTSAANLEKMKVAFPGLAIVPVCSNAELALRRASASGMIRYSPGAGDFSLPEDSPISGEQRRALGFVRERILGSFGCTGIQEVIDRAVLHVLGRIVVYPVANSTKLSDTKGQVLPDAYLVRRGTTAKELAYEIHTDLGERFIGAVDARTGRKLAADQVLSNGDVIRIISSA